MALRANLEEAIVFLKLFHIHIFYIAFFNYMEYNIVIMNSEQLKKYLKQKYPHTSSFTSGLVLFFVDIFVLMLCIGIGFFFFTGIYLILLTGISLN